MLDIYPCLYFSKVQWTLKASPKGSMGVVWTHFWCSLTSQSCFDCLSFGISRRMNTYRGQLLYRGLRWARARSKNMDTNTRTHTHTPQTQTMTQKQQKQISGRFETGMGANIDTDTNTYRQRHEQRTSRHANTQNMSSPLCTGKK